MSEKLKAIITASALFALLCVVSSAWCDALSVAVTGPTASVYYATASSGITLSGTATGAVTAVTWSNSRGGSGTCTGTTSWSVDITGLQNGDNMITVTSSDGVGGTAFDAITVCYDSVAPTVAISGPTASPTYTTAGSSVGIDGTASDDLDLAVVTWSNDRGGSGACSGLDNWFATLSLRNGLNAITVTATDAAGHTATDIITITCTAPITVAIATPTATGTYATNSTTVDLSGSVSEDMGVTSVGWSNDRGGSGTCSGTTSWSVTGVPLMPGDNVITITGQDDAANTGSDQITVTFADNTAPVVVVSAPTVDPTYSTYATSIAVSGTASDDVGVSIGGTWSNDRGGSGLLVGTESWSVASISLQVGVNVITITCRDAASNPGTDTLTVTRLDPAGALSVVISTPSASSAYTAASSPISISGAASTNATGVDWANSRGGSGTCTGTSAWSASGVALQDGANVITVNARNGGSTATDTITINYDDNVSPAVTITAPTSSAIYPTNSPSLDLGGTASDDGAVTQVTWSNDRGGTGTATGTVTWSAAGVALLPGVNVITATSYDAAGNTATDTLTANFIDITPPSVAITAPTAVATYSTNSPSFSFGGTASDDAAVTLVTWANSRGGTGTATGTTSWSASGIVLQSGGNILTVTARDAASHTATDTISVIFTDIVAPTVTITNPTSDPTYVTNSSTVDLSGTASDDVGVTSITWSNGHGINGTATGTANWTATGIPVLRGDNTVTITARDAVGHISTDVITVTFSDIESPVVTIATPVTLDTYSTTTALLTLAGTSTDNVAVSLVTWMNDRGGSGTATGKSNWSISGILLRPGVNVITVGATDASDNSGMDVITVTFEDTLAPSIKILTPTTADTYFTIGTSINLSGTASDDAGLASITWSNDLEGSGTATGTANWSVLGLRVYTGVNEITVTATDTSGHENTDVIRVTVPDVTPPSVSFTIPSASGTYDAATSPIAIGGIASDDVAVTQVTWSSDRGTEGTCDGASSWSSTGVKVQEGKNVFTVTATDSVGNSGTAQLTVNFRDTVNPTVAIVSPTTDATAATNSATVSLSGTADDNGGVTLVSWVNSRGGTGACSGTTAWSAGSIPLMLGVNIITITAKDAANRTATDTLTVTFVDTTGPTVVITSPTSSPNYTTTSATLNISGTAADDSVLSLVEWSCGTKSGSCSGKALWSASSIKLSLGTNIITVKATDTSGNVGTDVITVDYQDVKIPVVLIGLPTSSPKYTSKNTTINISGSSFDDTGVASVSWSSDQGGSGNCTGTTAWLINGVSLKEGDNVITIMATDTSGNTGNDIINVTLPDTIPPVIKLLTPTTADTYVTTNGFLDVTGTATDNVALDSVSWVNAKGGTGTCVGKASWTAASIRLKPGNNIITFSARDLSKNIGSTLLTVTYNDIVPPSVQIEVPSSEDTFTTPKNTATISGKAIDDNGIAKVTWANSLGGSGVATGTDSWRITAAKLYPGTNLITVTATDLAGNTATDTIQIILVDTISPKVAIVSPTDKSDYLTNRTTFEFGGTASDNVAVTAVEWTNDRGGSGDCEGTTEWNATGIPLVAGKNVITVKAYDASGRTATDSLNVVYDGRLPVCTITSSPNPTKKGPVVFNIAFSEAVAGLTADAIEVTGGVKGVLAGKGSAYTLPVTPPKDGVVTCKVPDSIAQDTAGNYNASSETCSVTYDATPPSVVVTPPVGPTKATSLDFAIKFSEPVVGFVMAKVTVVGGTKDKLTGSGDTYTLTVTTRGPGSLVTCKVAASVVQDYAGNNNLVSELVSVTYDGTAPRCVVSGPASPTRLFPIEFILTFSEPVYGLTGDKVSVDNGKKGALVGSGLIYKLPVMPMGEGPVTCTLPAGSVEDESGNVNLVSNALPIVYDGTSQSCLVSATEVPTKTSPIVFSIVFSKDVTGFSEARIVVTNGSVGKLTGSKAAYTLPVTPKSEGIVTCKVPAGVAKDAAGNLNTESNTASVIFDKTQPVCTVTAPGTLTSAVPIPFSIKFSEPVTGLAVTKISVVNGTKGTLTGEGADYALLVNPTKKGKVTMQVASGAAKDTAGNLNKASTVVAITYDENSTSCTVTGPASPTRISPITFNIKFTKVVTGFGIDGIVVTGGTKSSLSGVGSAYVLVVEPTGDGEVTCKVPAGAGVDPDGKDTYESNIASVICDKVGPTCVVTAPGSPTTSRLIDFQINFSEWATELTVDKIEVKGGTKKALTGGGASYVLQVVPTVVGDISCKVIATAVKDAAGNSGAESNTAVVTFAGKLVTCTVSSSAAIVNTAPIIYNVKFSEPVVDFTAATAAVTGGSVVAVSGTTDTYTAAVTPTRDGSVLFSVPSGAAHTAAGDASIESAVVTVKYDSTAPKGTVAVAAAATGLNPVDFSVTFTEPVSGLSAKGFAVTGGTVAYLLGAGSRYKIGVTPSADGEVTCKLLAGAAKDAAGNRCVDSTVASVIYDHLLLSVSVEQAIAQSDPALGTPVYYTVRFSRPVIGFNSSNVVIGGTAGACTAEITADGDAYFVAVGGMTGAGTVICSVPAGVVMDDAGVRNRASESLDNQISFSFGLTISITSPTGLLHTGPTVTLAGTATDDGGSTVLSWETNRGHSGFCIGGSSWRADDVPLEVGENQIKVMARDTKGRSGLAIITVTREDVAPGDPVFGLCMFSLPIIPDVADPKLVVGFAGDYWLRYLPVDAVYVRYPDPVTMFDAADQVRYRGYWTYFDGAPGACSGTVPDQTVPATIPLTAGWNLIGQPFVNSYEWNTTLIKVKVGDADPIPLVDAGDQCSDYMWGWNTDAADPRTGAYYLIADTSVFPAAVSTVLPWRGYWIRAFSDCALIVPSP